jgi:hypothetical protein
MYQKVRRYVEAAHSFFLVKPCSLSFITIVTYDTKQYVSWFGVVEGTKTQTMALPVLFHFLHSKLYECFHAGHVSLCL